MTRLGMKAGRSSAAGRPRGSSGPRQNCFLDFVPAPPPSPEQLLLRTSSEGDEESFRLTNGVPIRRCSSSLAVHHPAEQNSSGGSERGRCHGDAAAPTDVFPSYGPFTTSDLTTTLKHAVLFRDEGWRRTQNATGGLVSAPLLQKGRRAGGSMAAALYVELSSALRTRLHGRCARLLRICANVKTLSRISPLVLPRS